MLDPAKWAACEELLGHKWLGPSMYPCRSHVYFSYTHNFCNDKQGSEGGKTPFIHEEFQLMYLNDCIFIESWKR